VLSRLSQLKKFENHPKENQPENGASTEADDLCEGHRKFAGLPAGTGGF